ncbi:MAG: DUF2953 domain-containing protein [Oscillospiraceae bacterium]|nr:DUF2953 domain-containing protein [Oscillospiraceae bacterium]
MGWLIGLIVLTALALLPLGVKAIYRDNGIGVWILAGPVSVKVYPDSGKKKEKNTENKPKSKKKTGAEDEKTGGSLKDFEPLLRTVLAFVGDFRRKLKVKRLELQLVLAGEDPCNLAVAYGRAWAAVGNILPQMERIFVFKKRDVDVGCDFTSENTRIYVRVDLTIALGRLLYLLVKYGLRAFKEYQQIKTQRKGGAKL